MFGVLWQPVLQETLQRKMEEWIPVISAIHEANVIQSVNDPKHRKIHHELREMQQASKINKICNLADICRNNLQF